MINTATIRQAGYVPVNGLPMYYQIHGDGRPLVLLHGGLGLIEMFGALMPGLAQNHRVIAVELQGHGHTPDADRPLRFEQMADDVATLIRRLGAAPADILGFSLGGGVALQIAIRHQPAVRRLVVVSAPFRRDGWYPEALEGMAMLSGETAAAMVGSPMHDAYTRVAPEPAGWTALVAKTGDLLRRDYDWTEDIAGISAPTLVIAGDRDSLSPEHAVAMFVLLGGGPSSSALAILPDTNHFDILSPALVPIVTAFLGKSQPGEGDEESDAVGRAVPVASPG